MNAMRNGLMATCSVSPATCSHARYIEINHRSGNRTAAGETGGGDAG
jgi:hypothetical protein